MRIRGRNSSGQTLFLTFSVSKASLIVEGCGCQRASSVFASWKGDGCMKDTDHPIRHPRVHLGDRASAQRSESYARQNAQDGRGMAACWAGATPLFATGAWQKDHWGRSSLIDRTSHSLGRSPQIKTVSIAPGSSRRAADPWTFHASRIGEIAPSIPRIPRRRFVQAIRKPASLSDTASDNLYEQERRSPLSILKAPPKQPKTVTVQARVEESVKTQLELYAEFIDASPSYVITEALKLLFRKDDDFRHWAGQHTNNHNYEKAKGDVLAKAV